MVELLQSYVGTCGHCKETRWINLGKPAVNIIKNPICFCTTMNWHQVFLDPGDQVILEGAFDELMKNVRGNKTMDVGMRKVNGKRLFIRCEFKDWITLWKDIPQYPLQDHTPPKELLIQACWPVVLCDCETDGRCHHQGHLGEQYILSQRDQERVLLFNKTYLEHHSWQCMREALVRDNLQYKLQDYRQHAENGCQSIVWSLAWSFLVLAFRESLKEMNEIVVVEIFEILGHSHLKHMGWGMGVWLLIGSFLTKLRIYYKHSGFII